MRLLKYLWVMPNTLLGLAFVPLVLLTGGKAQWKNGVLETYGGCASWLLSDAAAVCFGHLVLARDEFWLEATREHEAKHVRQYERYGPFMLLLYWLASLTALIRGRHYYFGNSFERGR